MGGYREIDVGANVDELPPLVNRGAERHTAAAQTDMAGL
jgi:hypothetical protein